MNFLRNASDIPTRAAGAHLIHVVIDTPRGSRNKYKLDEALGVFKLSRVLPAGLAFPYDFGFIPGTKAEDGDALDVLVLSDAPLFAGCLVTVRLIGAFRAVQREQGKRLQNDRLVGAICTPVNQPKFRELRDLGIRELREIEHFFTSYNEAQGREFEITGRSGASSAYRLLSQSLEE